jgi:uncharacterized protein (TIGR00106 family)
MAIADISIVPIGTASTSLSPWVADLQRLLAAAPEPIRYEMTAMGTLVEGAMPDLLAVVGRLHEVPFASGAGRVYTVVKFDDRRDKPSTLEGKVASVRDKLR